MQAPPVPANEEQRLAELKSLDLLDTPPEEVFDRYTRRLANIFDAPISLMSLIDEDRQWWKSHFGLPPELAEVRSTARDLSVCGHVVGNNELVVIDDLAQDERFANNPLIQKTGMRFYAGAPLRTDSGQPIGSLCVIDTKPRHLTETEKQLLQLIAEDVMTEVKLRDASRKMTTLTEQVVAQAAAVRKDLDQARAVQRFLLPLDRQSCGSCSICYVYEPATQIGGDFVDVLSRADGSILIVVADAVGHGASAALLSVMIKSAFNRVGPTAAAPHEVLAAIQQELQAVVEPGRFITAIAAIKPADADSLLIASAGHYPPILLRDGDATVMEVEGGLPLLVDSSQAIGASAQVALKSDDRVVFFTDGAIEVMNEARELLGATGLRKLVQKHAQLRDKGLLQAIRADVAEFAGSTAAQDDITLVVLENVSSCEAASSASTQSGVLGATEALGSPQS
jgi:serine phosphatase RsbU (regulator of sigma subunit)